MAELKVSHPPFPNRDKHPFVATVRFRKMVIDVENLDGSTREGTDANGNTWKTNFRGAHYGEIRDSKGTDGDALDVYIKNPPDDGANMAYIIHQNHPRTHPSKPGEYDEDKVVLGVSSADEAKELYLRHYNRKDFLRSVTEMPIEAFKRYIFGENKAEKVADAATAFIRTRMRGNAMTNECKTPGEKIRSMGQGRGKAHGKGRGPIGIPVGKKEKKMEKEATISDMYRWGYELGMRDKLAQMGAMAAGAGPVLSSAMTSAMPRAQAPRNIPGVNAPNWPTQMPQAGPVTSPAQLKQQMASRQLRPEMFKKQLSVGM